MICHDCHSAVSQQIQDLYDTKREVAMYHAHEIMAQ